MDWAGLGVLFMGLCSVVSPTLGQNYYENVALGKTYNQSSAYTPNNPNNPDHTTANPARFAANGNTSGTYNQYNCIHTIPTDPGWWQVDLGAVFPLYNFKVWGRKDWNHRLYPFTITVDSQTCASVSSRTSREVDVTCSSITNGQVVRLTRTSGPEMLNMCEFQVFVCQDGWWGQQCDSPCSSDCVSCDRATGDCQENVALGKAYSQSSVFDTTNRPDNPASLAANGNTGGTYNSTNCIHTTRSDDNDWWEVDLGRVYPLLNFRVWGRDNFNDRLYPFNITVDDQPCASVPSGTTRNVDVTCSNIMYGQRVRIKRPTASEMLNMCEFQVLVPNGVSQCPVGTYGATCGSDCSTNCGGGPGNNFCIQNTGDCYGCAAGWYGSKCNFQCLATRCPNNRCDQQTGLCTACDGNFVGDYCTECAPGYYGSQCNSQCTSYDNRCVECTGNAQCTRCLGNYATPACTACTAEYYGIGCNTLCTSNNSKCLECTGPLQCTRCQGNFATPYCTACTAEYYGSNCNIQCTSYDSRCLECTGYQQCTRCQGNFATPTCRVCETGYYGSQCDPCTSLNSRCLQCTGPGQCTQCQGNFVTPACSECTAEYYGNNCNTMCTLNNLRCLECTGPGQCTRCQGNFATPACTGCVDRYYGADCTQVCPTSLCQRCDQNSGQCLACYSNLAAPGCTECRDDYYKQQPSDTFCTRCQGTCKDGTTCDKATGVCHVCNPGKQGDYCQQDCGGRTYGQNCTEQCGHCLNNGVCNVVNGSCPNGCDPGWDPSDPTCKTECSDGTYGPDCQETCGQCRDGAVCDKVTGHCPLCPPGLYQPLCNTECRDGTYGENCTGTCVVCYGGVPCNKVDGRCSCPAGKQPPFCQTDCHGKTYGTDCAQSCGQCRGAQACDPVTGHCSDGCQPGWTDLDQSSTLQLCQTACPAGLYGEGCSQPCGRCLDQAVCSHDTGICSQGCADGYTGPHCLQALGRQNEEGENLVGPLVGSITGVGLLMTISIVVAICWRRRSQDRPQRTDTAPSVSTVTDDDKKGLGQSPAVAMRDMNSVKPQSLPPPPPPPPPDPQGEQTYVTIADNDNYDKLHPYSNDNADKEPYAELTSDLGVPATASGGAYVNTAFKAPKKKSSSDK